MTNTMIPDGPEPGESRWFKPISGGLNDVAPSVTPSPHLDRQVLDQVAGALADIRATLKPGLPPAAPLEPQLVDSPTAEALPQRPGRHRHGVPVAELPGGLEVRHVDQCRRAARRVMDGFLDASERAAIAGVFKAVARLSDAEEMNVSLLATLHRAVQVLSAPRVQTTTTPATAAQDGVE